jgi:hypothetical protein
VVSKFAILDIGLKANFETTDTRIQ